MYEAATPTVRFGITSTVTHCLMTSSKERANEMFRTAVENSVLADEPSSPGDL